MRFSKRTSPILVVLLALGGCTRPPAADDVDFRVTEGGTTDLCYDWYYGSLTSPSLDNCGDGMVNTTEYCDDGTTGNCDDCTMGCLRTYRAFVTSTAYTGDLGGISGADQKCQDRADAAGLSGTWVSVTSISGNNARSRLTTLERWYLRLDNVIVTVPFTDGIFRGSLLNSISVDEFGMQMTGVQVWTNTNTAGEMDGASTSCSNWTSASCNAVGGVGSIDSSDYAWTEAGTDECCQQLHLYCVED